MKRSKGDSSPCLVGLDWRSYPTTRAKGTRHQSSSEGQYSSISNHETEAAPFWGAYMTRLIDRGTSYF